MAWLRTSISLIDFGFTWGNLALAVCGRVAVLGLFAFASLVLRGMNARRIG